MLAYDVVGDPAGGRTAVFLHGILANKSNWKGFARRACERVPGLRAVIVDLRGHGGSHGLAPPHTVAACAADVVALPFSPQVVIGHSFGGKVALQIAADAGTTTHGASLESVAVLDAPPGPRSFSPDGEIGRVIAAVRAVPQPMASRRAVSDALRAAGLAEAIALWMTTNVVEAPDGLRFAFDLDVVDALLGSFGALDAWPVLEVERARPVLHMVRAGRGDRFSSTDRARLDALARAGRVQVHAMEHVGHWLHAEDPEGLLSLLLPLLRGPVATI